MFDLTDKTAIVTGALGLLGGEHCQALAAAGASVVVTDVDGEGCRRRAAELSKTHGRPAFGHPLEVTDPASVAALRDAVLGRFDAIDVLINNAAINDKVEAPGVAQQTRFESYPVEQFRHVLDVNVTGVFLCCQILGAPMAQRGRGSIINIASTYGLVSPDQSLYRKADGSQEFFKTAAYPVSKAAVIQLTRYLACYWGGKVRVNALAPGGVRTAGTDPHFAAAYGQRTPVGRMAEADEYRGAIVFLASDQAQYMTGSVVVVDGGWTAW